MKLNVDACMMEYLLDHGIAVGEDGFLTVPKGMARRLSIDYSIRKPGVRVMAVPSVFGLTLLYENQHFEIK